MNKTQKGLWILVGIIVIVILVVLAVYAFTPSAQQSDPDGATSAQTIQATFTCDGGKTIDATFINATTATTTGNSVMLALSDGRQMNLPQVISADGARYANADQSFVFWNVGNQATIWENNVATYDNCVSQNSQ